MAYKHVPVQSPVEMRHVFAQHFTAFLPKGFCSMGLLSRGQKDWLFILVTIILGTICFFFLQHLKHIGFITVQSKRKKVVNIIVGFFIFLFCIIH